jgi:putative transposase
VFYNVLARDFSAAELDQAYIGDIIYIRIREGWLYLGLSIDLFSRRIVSWSMASQMTTRLVTDALNMDLWQRQPKLGLVVYPDRGSQYASNAYRRLLGQGGRRKLFCELQKRSVCSGEATRRAPSHSGIFWITL